MTAHPNAARLSLPPMGKPRQSRSDRWKKRPAVVRYRQWCDAVRMLADAAGLRFPDAGARIVYRFPMPASWSRKKRDAMRGQPHQQKPDIDNCTKALLDALLVDDATVWHLAGQEKRWADEGAIEIEVVPLRARGVEIR